VTKTTRVAEGWERTGLLLLLALWLLGFAAVVLRSVLEWRAVSAGDVRAVPQPALTAAAFVLLLAAWILALVLTARLRRWAWFVACLLLPIAIPAFAVVASVEPRERRTDARRHAAFEAAMAAALAEQEADRSQSGARHRPG
jgi:hypothetical protein